MPASGPSFSPFPFARLRRITRREAALESAVARFLDGHAPSFKRLVKLASGPVSMRITGAATAIDPHASLAEVRASGLSLFAAAPARTVRALAQQWLGGPDELDASRPLTQAEHGIWCLVVAAAIADTGIDAQVWPAFDRPLPPLGASVGGAASSASSSASSSPSSSASSPPPPSHAAHARAIHERDAYAPTVVASPRAAAAHPPAALRPLAAVHPPVGDAGALAQGSGRPPAIAGDHVAIELAVVFGNVVTTVVVFVPRAIELRIPSHAPYRGGAAREPTSKVEAAAAIDRPRPSGAWTFDLPIVIGRAAVARDAIARLGVRDIITIDRVLELEIGDTRIGLTAAPRAVEATVATGYLPRDMALPDDAHLELTVQLGTTRLSLRALSELAVGQIISLGRPLAGPFDVRAGGRLVGQGELIDIDGELGVRIVSLAQE